MENDSLGKVLPRLLFPYAQQWAERSGTAWLSRLLVDEQFHGLVEKYADDIVVNFTAAKTPRNGNGRANGKGFAPRREPRVDEAVADDDMAKLHDRIVALEAQQAMQQALLEALRTKIQPLALALGCCPECVAGIAGCPKCFGLSKVGHYPPDRALLEEQVIGPLAECGVPIGLKENKVSGPGRRPGKATTIRKEEQR